MKHDEIEGKELRVLSIEEEDAGPNTERDEESQEMLRRFQSVRDGQLGIGKGNILDNYMQLIVQYGYIVLFSSTFPLASVMSIIQNIITLNSQIDNMSYSRRYKAEVSSGIG